MSVGAAFSPGGSAEEGSAPTIWAAFRSLPLFFAGCWLLSLKSTSSSLLPRLPLHARLFIMSARRGFVSDIKTESYTT